MPYGNTLIFPPSTGQNLSRTSVVVVGGNTVDSVAGIDLNTHVTTKQSGLNFPAGIYDTAEWSISPTEVLLTNVSAEPVSAKFTVGGKFTGSSTANTALIQVQLNSTSGIGTGTTKSYSAGATAGATTISAGFTTIGAFTLQPGEAMWLECSKNVSGTLVLESCLILAELIY